MLVKLFLCSVRVAVVVRVGVLWVVDGLYVVSLCKRGVLHMVVDGRRLA